jgi:hypothetical protein
MFETVRERFGYHLGSNSSEKRNNQKTHSIPYA